MSRYLSLDQSRVWSPLKKAKSCPLLKKNMSSEKTFRYRELFTRFSSHCRKDRRRNENRRTFCRCCLSLHSLCCIYTAVLSTDTGCHINTYSSSKCLLGTCPPFTVCQPLLLHQSQTKPAAPTLKTASLSLFVCPAVTSTASSSKHSESDRDF